MKKLFLIIIISIASISVVRSQDFKYEIGAGAGIGFYMGILILQKYFESQERFSGGISKKPELSLGYKM